MSSSNHGVKVRPRGPVQDDAGNKKTFHEVRIPPDNVGNQLLDMELSETFVHDNIGNSLDDTPAHLKSGILSELTQKAARPKKRSGPNNRAKNTPPARHTHGVPLITASAELVSRMQDEDFMANLSSDFKKMLANKTGLPFSFSMKTHQQNTMTDNYDHDLLLSFKDVIENILEQNSITADIEVQRYLSRDHRIAVFFLSPAETDPIKNKELISALRQTINEPARTACQGGLNIFLALANAQVVIEEHLTNLGAKRAG